MGVHRLNKLPSGYRGVAAGERYEGPAPRAAPSGGQHARGACVRAPRRGHLLLPAAAGRPPRAAARAGRGGAGRLRRGRAAAVVPRVESPGLRKLLQVEAKQEEDRSAGGESICEIGAARVELDRSCSGDDEDCVDVVLQSYTWRIWNS